MPQLEASASRYLERLSRALMIVHPSIQDAGALTAFLRELIYPMILEWSQLPFLPPAELLALYDRYMDKFGQAEAFVRFTSSDDRFLLQLLEEELDGTTQLPVRQATRARALAIACPTPSLDGSYIGSIPELRERLKDDQQIREAFRAARRGGRTEVGQLFREVNTAWMADQVSTWSASSIRSFLSGRLRPKEGMREQLKAGVDAGAQALITALKAVIEVKTPTLDTFEAVLETVRLRPHGAIEASVLQRVLPLVAVEEPAWASQEIPTGGYADLSTRGTFDRLLISNLAYPDDEFARRFVENELLYYELEAPPTRKPPKQVVFLDASPVTWGIPRLAGAAVALSVVNRARERQAEAAVHAAGRVFEGLDLPRGVHDVLDYQRWEDDLEGPLDALLRKVGEDVKGHPTGADLFICTEASRLPALRAWAPELPSSVRLYVFASDLVDGRAALWRREAGAFRTVSTLSLAARELAPLETPPAPAPERLRALSPRLPQVNWDWGGDVTCATLAPDGLAVTGHENGEIHLWDAGRAVHLEHRITLSQPPSSLAVSSGFIVGVLEQPMMVDGVSSTVFRLPLRSGALVLLPSTAIRPGVRAGWLNGQFFWWKSHNELVHYNALGNKLVVHPGCLKPPQYGFLVLSDEKRLLWKSPDGSMLAHDLREPRPAGWPRAANAIRHEARYLAIDPEGRVAVRKTGRDTTSHVLWLGKDTPDATIPDSQQPRAVAAAADRLITSNTGAIWFWKLREAKILKQLVSPKQRVAHVRVGRAYSHKLVNAVLVEFEGNAGLVLHWHPEDTDAIQVDVLSNVQRGSYVSAIHGAKGRFEEMQGPAMSVGDFQLTLGSDRRIEFARRKDPSIRLTFWFRQGAREWVLASRDFVAGNALGSLVLPEGVSPVNDSARLARLLALGAGGI